jgi:hypothetical protein
MNLEVQRPHAVGKSETGTLSGQAGKSGDQRSGADPIAALQASPHREPDIAPARTRVSSPFVTLRSEGQEPRHAAAAGESTGLRFQSIRM